MIRGPEFAVLVILAMLFALLVGGLIGAADKEEQPEDEDRYDF